MATHRISVEYLASRQEEANRISLGRVSESTHTSWHNKEISNVSDTFGLKDLAFGLSSQQASANFDAFGANVLNPPRKNVLKVILQYESATKPTNKNKLLNQTQF